MTPMMTPNRPMALAKISMMRIRTNNLVSCASAKAAPAPNKQNLHFGGIEPNVKAELNLYNLVSC